MGLTAYSKIIATFLLLALVCHHTEVFADLKGTAVQCLTQQRRAPRELPIGWSVLVFRHVHDVLC